MFLCVVFLQETRIRASEKDSQSKAQSVCITNQYGGEEVTHTLTTDSREDTHRWMEAFWQHFYDMSESPTPQTRWSVTKTPARHPHTDNNTIIPNERD